MMGGRERGLKQEHGETEAPGGKESCSRSHHLVDQDLSPNCLGSIVCTPNCYAQKSLFGTFIDEPEDLEKGSSHQ